jgi:hypothetical protein
MTVDPDQPVTLTNASTEFAANIIVVVLADAGIEAMAFGSAAQAFGMGVGGGPSLFRVPIQVRARDLERARTILAANKQDSVDIDWDAIDVGERADDVPLTQLGRMPLPAKLALAIIGVLLLGGLIGAFLLSVLR